jgi:hypothetical protein
MAEHKRFPSRQAMVILQNKSRLNRVMLPEKGFGHIKVYLL